MNALEERLVTLAMNDLDEAKAKAELMEADNQKKEIEMQQLRRELDDEAGHRKITEQRLRDLGSEYETPEESGGVMKVVRAEAEQVAAAGRVSMWDPFDRNMQVNMAEKLALQLIENNYVQFINRGTEPLDGRMGTRVIEAKMFVIPWDKTGPKRIAIHR